MGHLEDKKSFRRELNRKKRLLSQEEFLKRDYLVRENLLNLLSKIEFTGIHSFMAMTSKKEPSTLQIVNKLYSEDKYVLISKSDFNTKEMHHYVYNDSLHMSENEFGIPEPIAGKVGNIDNVQVVLVPMLAADRNGNRLGYGKGFYDRFLGPINKEVIKIGLCIGPVFDIFNFVESHDIKMNYCVTPFETIDYK